MVIGRMIQLIPLIFCQEHLLWIGGFFWVCCSIIRSDQIFLSKFFLFFYFCISRSCGPNYEMSISGLVQISP